MKTKKIYQSPATAAIKMELGEHILAGSVQVQQIEDISKNFITNW